MIYAVVEGETTERDYLDYLERRFAGDPRTFEIKVLWKRNGLKPHEVVNRALEKLGELDDPQREQVWAFFDRDEHCGVEEAHAQAESAGVKVAFSHPCFELWLLLHFASGVSGARTSKGVQDQLRAVHPAFRDFGKSLETAHRRALEGQEAIAVGRAKTLITNCPSLECTARKGHAQECKVVDRVPSTEVWKLLGELGIVPC
ncbi:RloB family protein [Nonomuraea sp. NPDC050022]|uniref:RloB family protein n=1 Tax=unclassified Nonomuraea TaxID=2593643 RepID=UPI0033D5D514